jgi:flagellar hook-associated protein FlgK
MVRFQSVFYEMILSKQNIDRKIKKLLASGAKIIDLSVEPKKQEIYKNEYTGTFSNYNNEYLASINKIKNNNKFRSYSTHMRQNMYNSIFYHSYDTWDEMQLRTLISRSLPGRSKCNLMAIFDGRKFKTEVGIRTYDLHTVDYKLLGFIGSRGFESDNSIVMRHGECLSGSKLMSALVMTHSDVIATEGPNWDDVKDDTFWSTFEQDAWELTQVTMVIES